MTGDVAGANAIVKGGGGAEWLWATGRRKEAFTKLAREVEGLTNRDLQGRSYAVLAIWSMLLQDRDTAARMAERAVALATPANGATVALARFVTLPQASPAEWLSRSQQQFPNAPANSIGDRALSYALLLNGQFDAAAPLLKRLEEHNPLPSDRQHRYRTCVGAHRNRQLQGRGAAAPPESRAPRERDGSVLRPVLSAAVPAPRDRRREGGQSGRGTGESPNLRGAGRDINGAARHPHPPFRTIARKLREKVRASSTWLSYDLDPHNACFPRRPSTATVDGPRRSTSPPPLSRRRGRALRGSGPSRHGSGRPERIAAEQPDPHLRPASIRASTPWKTLVTGWMDITSTFTCRAGRKQKSSDDSASRWSF